MNFRTITQMDNTIVHNIHKIPENTDLIVAIPRSGLIPATLISLYRNVQMTDIERLKNGDVYKCGRTKTREEWATAVNDFKRIVVVDDSIGSGKSIQEAKQTIEQLGLSDKTLFLAVYVTEQSKKIADIYFEECSLPRAFEWNIFHHSLIQNSCIAIDGVLCIDPTEEQNDDGEKYIEFLQNAPLRIQPTGSIGALVTCRLEKYRSETEDWLRKHGIRFQELVMIELKTKEEMEKHASRGGEYKAEVYQKRKSMHLFIESDQEQAEIIARISGKPVYCCSNQEFYDGSGRYKMLMKSRQHCPRIIIGIIRTIKKFLRKCIK